MLSQLTDLPLEHFDLREAPYSASPNPQYLYASATHRMAIEKTRWAIASKRGLALCFGEVGTGKTTLARELVGSLGARQDVVCAFVTNPSYPSATQLLRAIMAEFDVLTTARSYVELLATFKRHLITEVIERGRTMVLIIDEAQALTPPLLEVVRQLMNVESNEEKLLQIVLVGQEELRVKLKHARYRYLVSRAAMVSTLVPLSLEESGAMLAYRWQVAGGQEFPFTDGAVEAIWEASGGRPRTQVILADNCVLAAALARQDTIDADLVERVVADRGLPDTVAPAAPIKARASNKAPSPRRKAS